MGMTWVWRTLLSAAMLLLAAAGAHAAEPAFPALTGRVVDEAGILSPQTRDMLTSMLANHEQETHQQVVVVTLKSLQGYEIADYGYRLGRAWGIGEKDKNTGALLIVVPSDHKVRIEVGYGLEGELTDAASRTIIEQFILPAFRSGDFNAGVLAGTTAILRTLGGSAAAGAAPSYEPRYETSSPWSTVFVILAVLVFVILRIWMTFALPFYGVLQGRRRYGSGGDWFGGSGGSWGGSGGGFSGGGGSFGGGGATGSW